MAKQQNSQLIEALKQAKEALYSSLQMPRPVHANTIEYVDKQGTDYPISPHYIAMIKAQLREAYTAGWEASFAQSEIKSKAALETINKLIP